MTTSTATVAGGSTRASSGLWIVLLVLAAGIVALAFVGRDDVSLGGRADPQGTGRQGLAALRIMIEETGGTTSTGVHAPTADHDVAVLATESYAITAAFLGVPDEGQESGSGDEPPSDALEQVFAPILDWVEGGGRLVTGVDLPGGPEAAFTQTGEAEIAPGACDVDGLGELTAVSMPDHVPIEVAGGDTSCFGDGEQAIVVVRSFGEGQIVRVAGFEPFFNQRLDERDNGALAARSIGMGAQPSVAFLSGPDPALLGGPGGPVDDEGNPIGTGEGTLFDLVPTRVIALMVGLAGAALVLAYAVGRRIGSPVSEPLPVELPSSSYTEAVGRLYARAEEPRARSARILRSELRTSAARRVGLSAAADDGEIARALSLTTGLDADSLSDLLAGPEPTSDEQLVELARRLADLRSRMTRGHSAVAERNIDDRSTV